MSSGELRLDVADNRGVLRLHLGPVPRHHVTPGDTRNFSKFHVMSPALPSASSFCVSSA